MWAECHCIYSVIVNNKKGYSQHPATKEFKEAPEALFLRLQAIRIEMLSRGYKPKELPVLVKFGGKVKEWQDYDTQLLHLKSKNCECKV